SSCLSLPKVLILICIIQCFIFQYVSCLIRNSFRYKVEYGNSRTLMYLIIILLNVILYCCYAWPP
ncbi:MAG: hypothetical protein ACKPKO_30075, partial [Candidatus Fonsibacter sp.]